MTLDRHPRQRDVERGGVADLAAWSSSLFLYSPERTCAARGSANSSAVFPSVFLMEASARCWRRAADTHIHTHVIQCLYSVNGAGVSVTGTDGHAEYGDTAP